MRIRRPRSPLAASPRYRLLLAHGQVGPLSREQMRTIADYARDVLHDRTAIDELRIFTALAGEFRPGWITQRFLNRRVLPRISTPLGRSLGPTRTLLTTVMGREQVPEVGRRVGGRWFDPEGDVADRARIAAIASEHGPRVIAKMDGSHQAEGVQVMTVDELRASEPYPGTDLVVQYLVRPHPVLGALSPGSTPPLRLLTVLRAGRPTLAATHLRLGTGSRPVAGGPETLRVAVSLDGVLGDRGMDRSFRLHTVHPTTGDVFGGIPIPSFHEAVAFCLTRHRRLPHAGAIGWDVAVDEDGAIHLMEINSHHPGILFHEALAGPNFVGFGWERFAARTAVRRPVTRA